MSDQVAQVAQVAQVLRAAGHRVTAARRAVYTALADADAHVTADQLANAVGDQADIATVYRVLALLEQLDLARSARLGNDATTSWELAHPDEHFHLVCQRCGAVDHHVGDAVTRLRTHLLEGHGFAAQQVTLVVTGECASCRGVADRVQPPSQPASGTSDQARKIATQMTPGRTQ